MNFYNWWGSKYKEIFWARQLNYYEALLAQFIPQSGAHLYVRNMNEQ